MNASIFKFPEVRVVEASAGSGKTFALAKRYVQILLNPRLYKPGEAKRSLEEASNLAKTGHVPMRNVLAITFTNKAAFEMKARILEFLKRIVLNRLTPEQETEILAPIGLTQSQAEKKAFVIMEELIHNYNFFQVQTIDSFINAILSGCAFKIGLSANFRIKHNYAEYLAYSLDAMIERSARDRATLTVFADFLQQYLFLENKPGWFPKKDILGLLEALYQKNNTYGYPFSTYDLKGEDLIVKKQKILKAMASLKEAAPEGTDRRFLTSLSNFLERYNRGFDIDKLSDYFNREEIPVRKGEKVPAKAAKLWDKIRAELKELSEAEAYSLFNPYIEVFNGASGDFHAKARRDDVLFLSELNKKANELFDEGRVTVEELYYRLATRVHHYLIDEFQDTSRLQWQNLQLMVEEALSTGGSLFYVGDKKQAIYGFRGGEAVLFDEVKSQFEAFNVQTERLTNNYRSQKRIVDFNNAVFSSENLQNFLARKGERDAKNKKSDARHFRPEDIAALNNVFAASAQAARPENQGGYVKVEFVKEDKKDKRDEMIREKLIARVKDIRERFRLSDIALLTRSNSEVEQVTSWLLSEGISVESERTLNIKENALVAELIALLKFLSSPIDNAAFAQFVLGDIFTRASGIPKEEMHAFLFELRPRLSGEKDFYIYRSFREAHPDIWETRLDEFFKNVGLYPLYELTTSIVHRLKVLEHFPDQQGFIMRLLELIKEQEEETSDIASFLEVFDALESEDLYVQVSGSDAIKVQTVHKSKGLEFPVVIIPFLGMDVKVGSGGNLGQQSYLTDVQDGKMELLRIKDKYLNFSEPLKEIYHREYVAALLSELNNIYVALTRAAQELHVFVPSKAGQSFNLAQFLIPEEVLEIGSPSPPSAARPTEDRPRMALGASVYHDWISFLKDEFMDPGEIINRGRLHYGDVLHCLLSHIDNLNGESLKEQLAIARAKAERQFPGEDWDAHANAVAKLLNAPELRSFFDIPGAEVFTEKEVVNSFGDTRRIDRLIVGEREVTVVDYKLRREPEADYAKQVKEYMGMVSKLYPGRKVKGVLVYIEEKEAEEV